MSKDIEGLNISVKSLLSVGAILFLLIGEYVVLHKEIEEAKRLPISKVSELEIVYLKKDIETLNKKIELLNKKVNK